MEIAKYAIKDSNTNDGHALQARKDLAKSSVRTWFWLWGIPLGLIVVSSFRFNGQYLPDLAEGGLFAIASLWFGSACFVNGIRCGRVHCKIDGVLMPLLALLVCAQLLGFWFVSWGVYIAAFWGTLVASYIPEYVGFQYLKSK